jgi:hypothetical protein
MIVRPEQPGNSLRDRVPALVFLVCFIGLLAYFASAPVWQTELNPGVDVGEWFKRFAAVAIVFAVVLAPLVIAALHERAMHNSKADRLPRTGG